MSESMVRTGMFLQKKEWPTIEKNGGATSKTTFEGKKEEISGVSSLR